MYTALIMAAQKTDVLWTVFLALSHTIFERQLCCSEPTLYCFSLVKYREASLPLPWALCGLRGCKNRAHSVSWPEVVKAVPNQGVDCFVSWGSFFCFSVVFLVYVVLCLIVFGCQYQCNWLPGKTRLRNDLLCVEWDVKPYTVTHFTLSQTAEAALCWDHICSTQCITPIWPNVRTS